MDYSFDTIIERRNTASSKWDNLQARFGRDDVLPLWVADMDFEAPKVVIDALRERVEHGVFGYTIRTSAYQEAIRNWFMVRHQYALEPEWLEYSHGVVHGLAMMIRAVTRPGDAIVIQQPVYFPFKTVVERQGRRLLVNPLLEEAGRYQMDLEHLERLFQNEKPKWMILCSPHNPIGRVWSKEELTALAKLCAAYDVSVLSDEIHCDFVYRPHQHHPFATLLPEMTDRTVTFVAPSKTFNIAGLHTAVVIIPNEQYRQQYRDTLQEAFMGDPDVFGPVALEAAYRGGGEWLDALLVYLEGNYDFLREFLRTELPDISVSPLEGTYLAWLDFRKLGMTDESLKDWMISKARLGLNAGETFGVGGSGFQRMNLGCPRPILADALVRLSEAVQQL